MGRKRKTADTPIDDQDASGEDMRQHSFNHPQWMHDMLQKFIADYLKNQGVKLSMNQALQRIVWLFLVENHYLDNTKEGGSP